MGIIGPGVGCFLAFILGLSEIFSGEAGQIAESGNVNKHVAASFKTMRFIVTVGWSIYPLGYFLGYLCGAVASAPLNLVYNLADMVNKIAFCPAIWASAKNSTLEEEESRKKMAEGLLGGGGSSAPGAGCFGLC